MSAEIEHLKREMSQMAKSYNSINTKLDRLLVAVSGDDKMGVEGIAPRLERHEAFIQGAKIRDAKHRGILAAIVFGWGMIIKFWDRIFG